MLDTKAPKLIEEVLGAEKQRDKRLTIAKRIVRQYHTGAYEGSHALDDPENHAFEYLSIVVPQMMFENPRYIVNGGGSQEAADLQDGLNRWVRWNNLREVGRRIATDQAICMGVAELRMQPIKGWVPGEVNLDGSYDVPVIPRVRRVPPGHFFIDALARAPEEARLSGVACIRDHDDLFREALDNPKAGWNRKAIAGMKGGTDVNKYRPSDQKLELERNEVAYYEVWIPEEELSDSLGPEHGFYGTIRTIACAEGGAVEIRDPRPYYGSRKGPFILFGSHYVPDRLWPLSSLIATWTQNKDLNANAISARKAAARKKKIGLGDGMSHADTERIKAAEDGDFLIVSGLKKDLVTELSLAGVDEQQIVQMQIAKDRLDKAAGLSDAVRGMTTGDATATENAIAASGVALRVELVKREFQAGMRDLGERAGEQLYNNDRVQFPMPDGSVFFGGSPRSIADRVRWMWPGVEIPDDFGLRPRVPYEAMEVDVEPTSMERPNQPQMQRNAIQGFDLATRALPMMAQFPDALPWREMFNRIGEAFGDPNLGERIRPAEATKSMTLLSMLGVQGGAQGGGALNVMGGGGMASPGTGGRPIGTPPGGGMATNLQRRANSAAGKPTAQAKVPEKRMAK